MEKRQGSTELPRFAVGALAIAGASVASGATVQITFTNSYISTTGGNHLVTDFGGDLTNDITGAIRFPGGSLLGGGYASVKDRAGAFVASGNRSVWWLYGAIAEDHANARVGDQTDWEWAPGQAQVMAVVAFSLVDANVRGGAATSGWLHVAAQGRSSGELGRVEVLRFIFDDASGVAPLGVSHASGAYSESLGAAVPEPSSLGLLALGAGGLLARRRRAA